MRVSFADASLAGLDAAEGLDALGLFVFEDERPLRGLAGHVDWRLCGALSRILQQGRFVGAPGDALLFPSGGQRIFCFGAGPRAALGIGSYAGLVKNACQALAKAGARASGLGLPEVPDLDPVERARIFLADGASQLKGERVVLFGDARALAKEFAQAGRAMGSLQIDKEPLGAASAVVTTPPRGGPPARALRAP